MAQGINVQRTSRREFLGTSLSAGAVLGVSSALGNVLVGCGSKTSVVRGACPHDGPDTCACLVTSQNGKLVNLEADPHHPLTRGVLCQTMDGYLNDVVFNPERLLYPLRRVVAQGRRPF
jgi:anaerobic selenocysteine-containing dehydrogenase